MSESKIQARPFAVAPMQNREAGEDRLQALPLAAGGGKADKSCATGVNCVVYYSSATGNTQNFVERLGVPAVRLEKNGETPLMDRPYVIISPTYADGEGRGALPKAIIHFLNMRENRVLLRGVVAGGNRNFGVFYACAGDVIAYKCGVPCLYRYELRGMPADIANVRRILAQLQG